MLDVPSQALGPILSVGEYLREFDAAWSMSGSTFYKFEFRQSFIEPENESWLSYQRGDDQESVRLLYRGRKAIAKSVAEVPFQIRRVRIVAEPWSSYLEWELRALKIRAEVGEDVRVLPLPRFVDMTGQMEAPELVAVGEAAAFEVLYDKDGLNIGARSIRDMEIVREIRRDVECLHQASMPISAYLD